MHFQRKDIVILSGTAHQGLAEGISKKIGLHLGSINISRFSDGEIGTTIKQTVRGSDVYVIQSTCFPVNENIMELLIIIDALKRASARSIIAVVPYFGYARQDRKAKARDPISAKLVANLLTTAGANRILTMDFHAPQIQGFFDIPVDHLSGIPILAKYYKNKFKNDTENLIAVSPDVGSVTRARHFAQYLNIPIAIIDKRRQSANECEIMNIIGDVRDKKVILVDDLIDTAGTIVKGANALKNNGASEIYACCVHGVLSGSAMDMINESSIQELVTLDTIPLDPKTKSKKIKTLEVASIFAKAIERIDENVSISQLFTELD